MNDSRALYRYGVLIPSWAEHFREDVCSIDENEGKYLVSNLQLPEGAGVCNHQGVCSFEHHVKHFWRKTFLSSCKANYFCLNAFWKLSAFAVFSNLTAPTSGAEPKVCYWRVEVSHEANDMGIFMIGFTSDHFTWAESHVRFNRHGAIAHFDALFARTDVNQTFDWQYLLKRHNEQIGDSSRTPTLDCLNGFFRNSYPFHFCSMVFSISIASHTVFAVWPLAICNLSFWWCLNIDEFPQKIAPQWIGSLLELLLPWWPFQMA